MTIGSVFPIIPAVIKALIVGKSVFDVIDREPKIKSPAATHPTSKIIDIEQGIRFDSVHFRYPTTPEGSPDQLQGATFTVKPYTSTAIVGPSGAGKSTIV